MGKPGEKWATRSTGSSRTYQAGSTLQLFADPRRTHLPRTRGAHRLDNRLRSSTALAPTGRHRRPPAVCRRHRPRNPRERSPAPAASKLQVSFSYSDGFGREIQKKIQAEPGPFVEGRAGRQPALGRQRLDHLQQQGQARPPVRAVLRRHARLRVRASRWASARFCFTTRSIGWWRRCIPITRWEKVVFDPWRQETWDVNDTVLVGRSRERCRRAAISSRGCRTRDYLPTWYALRTIRRSGGAALADAKSRAAADARRLRPREYADRRVL